MMKDEKIIRYEKPLMSAYRFLCPVAVGATPPQGGDIEEGCNDSDFDEWVVIYLRRVVAEAGEIIRFRIAYCVFAAIYSRK